MNTLYKPLILGRAMPYLGIIFLSVLIGVFASLDNSLLIFVLLIGIIGTVSILLFLIKKPDRIVLFLLAYVVFQNFFAILLAKYGGSSISSGFIMLKDVIAYFSLILAMAFNYKKFKLTKPDFFAFFYFFTLIIYLIVPSDASFYLKLVQFRQLTTPVVLYLLGRFIILNPERLKVFFKILINFAVIATLFGIFERYVLGDSFWLTIGMTEYMSAKGMDKWAYLGGLPGNYYSYDLYAFVGASVRRIASFIADPTLYGQFLILPITLLLFSNIITGKKRFIYVGLLIFGLLAAISKGGILALGLALVYKTFRSRFRVLGIVVMSLLVVGVLGVLQNAHLISSLPAHLHGLTHNISLMQDNPFGLGLGEAGNITTLGDNSSGGTEGAGESYIGMIIGQLGIFTFPFILFIITLFNFYRRVLIKNDTTYKGVIIALPATLIGTVAASMLSESAISFISAGMFFLFIGCTVRIAIELNERNKSERFRRRIVWENK